MDSTGTAWGVLQARLEDAAHTRPVAQSSNRSRMDGRRRATSPGRAQHSCPFCRAEPGDLCHDLAGMASYSPHPERFGDGAIPLRGPRRARR